MRVQKCIKQRLQRPNWSPQNTDVPPVVKLWWYPWLKWHSCNNFNNLNSITGRWKKGKRTVTKTKGRATEDRWGVGKKLVWKWTRSCSCGKNIQTKFYQYCSLNFFNTNICFFFNWWTTWLSVSNSRNWLFLLFDFTILASTLILRGISHTTKYISIFLITDA